MLLELCRRWSDGSRRGKQKEKRRCNAVIHRQQRCMNTVTLFFYLFFLLLPAFSFFFPPLFASEAAQRPHHVFHLRKRYHRRLQARSVLGTRCISCTLKHTLTGISRHTVCFLWNTMSHSFFFFLLYYTLLFLFYFCSIEVYMCVCAWGHLRSDGAAL